MCPSKNKCTVGLDMLEKYVRAFAMLSSRGRHLITVPRGFPSDRCMEKKKKK